MTKKLALQSTGWPEAEKNPQIARLKNEYQFNIATGKWLSVFSLVKV